MGVKYLTKAGNNRCSRAGQAAMPLSHVCLFLKHFSLSLLPPGLSQPADLTLESSHGACSAPTAEHTPSPPDEVINLHICRIKALKCTSSCWELTERRLEMTRDGGPTPLQRSTNQFHMQGHERVTSVIDCKSQAFLSDI